MNQITKIAFAGALGFLGLACGWTAPASAQVDPGMNVAVGGTAGITDGTRAGNGEGRAELIASLYGDVLGRDASGGENGLIGLLNQEATGPKADGMLTDLLPAVQTNGDGKAELIVGAGAGGENGLIGLLRPQGLPTDQLPAVQKTTKLNSLASLGSVGDLFPLSRGDNNTPAVRSAGAGPHVKVFDGNGATQGGGPHVNPGTVKSINFTNQGGAASGKTTVNQGILNNTAGGNTGAPRGTVAVKTR